MSPAEGLVSRWDLGNSERKPHKLLRLLLVTRNLQAALHAWRIGVPWLHLERQGKRVVLKGTNIACEDLPSPLPHGFSFQAGFLAPFDFDFQVLTQDSNRVVLLDTGEVKLWLDGADVIFIAQEVFGNQEYGVIPSQESIVIDIGMNVATTALYFAKEPNVKRVIAFEPSSQSIKRAERNFALNPVIAKKIEVRPYALGETSGQAYLEVIPERSTVSRIVHDASSETEQPNQELVEIRDAEKEIQMLLGEAKDHQQIVLKVDCEGSEREIFRRLSPGTLSKIDVVLLEWHSPEILQEIRQTLDKLPFRVLVQRREKNIGMLYAFRKRC
jgi:FkbM family methyltransferase